MAGTKSEIFVFFCCVCMNEFYRIITVREKKKKKISENCTRQEKKSSHGTSQNRRVQFFNIIRVRVFLLRTNFLQIREILIQLQFIILQEWLRSFAKFPIVVLISKRNFISSGECLFEVNGKKSQSYEIMKFS